MSQGGAGDEVRVLCVEDVPVQSAALEARLEEVADRITVTRAASGQEALEHLDATEVDCVVSDYDMPDMDGLSLLGAVRVDDPEMPFILFTGRRTEEITSLQGAADLTSFVEKGTGRSQYVVLAQRIEEALDRPEGGVSADRARDQAEAFLDASSNPVVVAVGGEVAYANPPAGALFGVGDPAELLGAAMGDLLTGDLLEDVRAGMETGDRTVDRAHGLGRTLSGEELSLEVTSRPVTWDGRRGVLAVLRPMGDGYRDRFGFGSREGEAGPAGPGGADG